MVESVEIYLNPLFIRRYFRGDLLIQHRDLYLFFFTRSSPVVITDINQYPVSQNLFSATGIGRDNQF